MSGGGLIDHRSITDTVTTASTARGRSGIATGTILSSATAMTAITAGFVQGMDLRRDDPGCVAPRQLTIR